MSSLAKTTRATVILCFPLSKCAAIEWLCATLGVEKHRVVPNDDGTVAHAQLASAMDDHGGVGRRFPSSASR